MLRVQRINHGGLVLLHVRNSLLQGEACRVEAYKDVTAEPLLDGSLEQHRVVEGTNLDLFISRQEFEDLAHGS